MHVSRLVFVVAAVSLGAAPAFAQRGASPKTHAPAPQAAVAHPTAPAPATRNFLRARQSAVAELAS